MTPFACQVSLARLACALRWQEAWSAAAIPLFHAHQAAEAS